MRTLNLFHIIEVALVVIFIGVFKVAGTVGILVGLNLAHGQSLRQFTGFLLLK